MPVGTTSTRRRPPSHRSTDENFTSNFDAFPSVARYLAGCDINERYEVKEELGRGRFATVKRCECRDTGRSRAAKFMRKARAGLSRDKILHEVMMLDLIRGHKRMVDVIEIFENSREIVIVLEHAVGGELYRKLVVEEQFSEPLAARFVAQLLEGVNFLHQNNIVHCDIKPHNMLLTDSGPKGEVKLCDFGLSRLIMAGASVKDIKGTPDYVAPEILLFDPIGPYSDMWSVGVLVYVLLTGYSPFTGDDNQETYLNITQGGEIDFPEDIFGDVSELAQDFIRQLLVRQPLNRPTASECMTHPWIASYNPPVSSLSSSKLTRFDRQVSAAEESLTPRLTASFLVQARLSLNSTRQEQPAPRRMSSSTKDRSKVPELMRDEAGRPSQSLNQSAARDLFQGARKYRSAGCLRLITSPRSENNIPTLGQLMMPTNDSDDSITTTAATEDDDSRGGTPDSLSISQ